ncbi:hypothetical protein [Streptomyces pinistramenti]|uniref:hypothetical protein n=1 Tax=Streptomyces pinistramenti TaxID=2884812 RepID=UPI001D089830|nr:hypothetical protein [Streptomyces pinistramenti]MCB5909082.1 hypothetical protein [Streptomyces pinistramenti]
MAQDVLLDYDDIKRVATTMENKFTDIASELKQLETTVSALLKDGLVFEQSSPALEQAYQAFSKQMNESSANIKVFAQSFTDIVKTMTDSDGQIAAGVRSSSNG